MTNSEIIDVLNLSSLFNNFSKDDLDSMINNPLVHIKKYSKEETIFFHNDTCNDLSILISGKVEIQQNDANGNTLVVTTLNRANMFGENLLFGDKNTYPMDVVSKENSTVIHINKKEVTKLLQSNQTFLLAFLKLLSNKAMILSNKLRQVSSKSLRHMICDFLIKEAKKQNSDTIKLTMTKQSLADSFGVQRPSLSRELINMKQEKMIDYDRKTIKILNFDKIYIQ
ncbi:Crp/Fnr family transcriptional regulator [Clostridium sardiniense]|uniref:Crp/Fnr family transcriptional regulator n=1 Tax=Clostridium sardiniense TaxID=29369 RepID=A0ABS7KYX2_CLOSR|nr:Crp/Fnr family transcriptional regulator [Clostridium sardiniense]MBM7833983.1 CRP-like cAMP-binding protein [Clostridium sardiniense]MBY0756005.1 Crp/Fnr family transcriptional regulator [Clostridium sardiniense]MDQ0460704.1 CRP-like cAMP-binding protein [Clostridium sardiniense]